MLNRNAEALFWIGRYMERAENHARLVDVHYHIQHEGDFAHEEHKWSRLVDAFGARGDYLQQFEQFTERDVISFITLDRGYGNSLFSCVSQARGNLRTIREKVPSELWEAANSFYLWLGEILVADILAEGPNNFFRQVKEKVAVFQGVEHSVMQREQEWHFIECGRFLERAENTVRILQSVLGAIRADQAAPYPYLIAVLKSVSGYQAFRRVYADGLSGPHIMEFLLTKESFPRSVYFSFLQLEEHLEEISLFEGENPYSQHEKARRKAGRLKAELGCLDRDDLGLPETALLLEQLTEGCRSLGRTMADTFFRMEAAAQ
jgi:uncharacterized alpha-E superfamily protein